MEDILGNKQKCKSIKNTLTNMKVVGVPTLAIFEDNKCTDWRYDTSFGDWENDEGSKIVDEDTGKPLKVYHGTSKNFTEFDLSKKHNFDDKASKIGVFFSEEKGDAEHFGGGEKSRIIEAYLNIKNPMLIDDDVVLKHEKEWLSKLKDSDPDEYELELDTKAYQNIGGIGIGLEHAIVEANERPSYDGAIVDLEGGAKWFIAFEPNQIKSVEAEEFDPKSNNIYKAELLKAKDISKLIKKVIVNKSGKQQIVYVRAPQSEWKPGQKPGDTGGKPEPAGSKPVEKPGEPGKKPEKPGTGKEKTELWKKRVGTIKDAIRGVLDSALAQIAQRESGPEVIDAIEEQRANLGERKRIKEGIKVIKRKSKKKE